MRGEIGRPWELSQILGFVFCHQQLLQEEVRVQMVAEVVPEEAVPAIAARQHPTPRLLKQRGCDFGSESE